MSQGLTRGPRLLVGEPQRGLDGVDNPPPPRVDAEVVHGLLEVRDVGLGVLLGVGPRPLARSGVPEVLDLLPQRQRQDAQRFDVLAQGVPRNLHERLVQLHAHVPLLVLLLENTLVGLVRGPHVRPHCVEQLVLRPRGVGRAVRQ